MSFAESVSGLFEQNVQARGAEHYRRGRVDIDYMDDDRVEATVEGTRLWEVSLHSRTSGLSVRCSCPQFQKWRTACEHMWAVVLAADAGGFMPSRAVTGGRPSAGPRAQPRNKEWQNSLMAIPVPVRLAAESPWPPGRQVLYELAVSRGATGGHAVIALRMRDPRKSGEGWCAPKALRIDLSAVDRLPDPADREILSALSGAVAEAYWSGTGRIFDEYRLSRYQSQTLLPRVVGTGRCLAVDAETREAVVVRLDPRPDPWRFVCEWAEEAGGYALRGCLRRDAELRSVREAQACLYADGWVLWPDGTLARMESEGCGAWIEFFQRQLDIPVPARDADAMLKALLQRADLPEVLTPPSLGVNWTVEKPVPRVRTRWPRTHLLQSRSQIAELSFAYGHAEVNPFGPAAEQTVFDARTRTAVRRDLAAERAFEEDLLAAGFARTPYSEDPAAPFEIAITRLPEAVAELAAKGWRVESEGRTIRRFGRFALSVSSGMDWFDVHGRVDFDGASAELPALLAAARQHARVVTLSDGSVGILEADVLKRLEPLLKMGRLSGEGIRFGRCQAGLLDALLAAEPEVLCDEAFLQAREALQSFSAIAPADPPETFQGELRPYQREGLAWLGFLQRFGFGGCLADDMGLGKTVQVLALLEQRRRLREDPASGVAPSLVVVPRSLVFNWKQEALRFTPRLRIIDHTGIERARDPGVFADFDVVLTTYGTLRSDIPHFKDFVFDYIILDEAQAIKNAGAQTTKAARLLKGRHRLAMSGTPVQNHLGELWSLFEVLNPGMLGSAAAFRTAGAGARNATEADRALLARALRPFILRRTKGQVARDLPDRTEETVWCEMEARQAAEYAKLKAYYQRTLLSRVDRSGMNRSKIQVLEALLRLRQAACHPALIDPERGREPSAKLTVLMDQLDEVLDGGHKALVFSQFTSFLAIVRRRLDERKLGYEYLDGQTADRQTPVERFQNDPASRLFLVSLKAGGLGLNLTAAEYVFLLDPWWNPAIEAQAIDRAHRIGQSRRVFAYRLIVKDTVEEKVLALQEQKRDLADSIIGEDNSLIRTLTRDDLALLLS